MPQQIVSVLQLTVGAVLLSTGSASIKGTTFSAIELTAWRAVVITVFVFVAVRPPRRCWTLRIVPAAAAHALTTILFITANKLTTGATAIFLHYTAPLYVFAFSPIVLKEAVRPRDFVFVIVMACGLALLVLHPGEASATAPDPQLGAIIACGGGIAWAFTTLTMRSLARDESSGFHATMASVVLANFALAAAILPGVGIPATATPSDWWLVAYMGVVQLGLAFILIAAGLRHVRALDASLILLIEPVVNPLWLWLWHREEPGMLSLLGGAVILAATAYRSWVTTRQD